MKAFFFTRKFPLLLVNISSMLILLLLSLSILFSLFPSKALTIVEKTIFSNYSINYSAVTATGFLNPKIHLKDLKIITNKSIFEANTFIVDLNLGSIFLSKNSLIKSLKIFNAKVSGLENNGISEDFFELNSEIIFYKSNLINGYINLINNNENGNIYFSFKDDAQNFLINLPSNNWIEPFTDNNDIKNSIFSVKLIGGVENNSIFSIGSFHIDTIGNQIDDIKGKFIQSYKDNTALLSFSSLNKSFLEKSNLLAVDFKNKVLRLSSLNISNDLINLNLLQNIEQIHFSNLTYMFGKKLFFSSSFKDLNLKDIYLDSAKNLSGIVLANEDLIELKVKPSMVDIRTSDGAAYGIKANGSSYYDILKKELTTELFIQNNESSLEFKMLNKESGASSIDLSAKDIQTDFFIALFPESIKNIKQTLSKSIKSDSINNLLFSIDYGNENKALNSFSGSIRSGDFIYEVSDSQRVVSQNIDLNLKDNFITFVLDEGSYNEIPFTKAKVLINTQSQELFYTSKHLLKSKDIQSDYRAFGAYLPDDNFFPIESAGKINLKSYKNKNFTHILIDDMDLNISDEIKLENINSEIYILNFEEAFGIINTNIFNQNITAYILGKDILSSASIDISSEILLDMDSIFPGSELLSIQGKELSDIKISYKPTSGLNINLYNNLSSSEISSQIKYFKKPKGKILDTYVEIYDLQNPNIFVKNDLFEVRVSLKEDTLNGYFKSGDYFDKKIASIKNSEKFKIFIDIPQLNFEDLNLSGFENNDQGIQLDYIEFHFDELLLFGNIFSRQTGSINIFGNSTELSLKGKDLNGKISIGPDGFTKINLEDSKIRSFLLPSTSRDDQYTKMRLIGRNIYLDEVFINSFDLYILENKDVLTIDNIKINSDRVNIEPLEQSDKAYISFNKKSDLYKVKGIFELNNPPQNIQNYLNYNFDYLKSSMNIEWTSTKELNNLQGKLSFLVKDLKLEQEISNSMLLKALGIFNLRSFFSTIAEIDLSDENRSNLNINRGEGSFIFMKDQARISDPLVIETNFAKMKWIGDIKKDRRKNLSDLDLFLEMRLTISDNLPWYAAFLGGPAAAAGGMVIGSIFEEGITEISTLNYQVTGNINKPKLLRLE